MNNRYTALASQWRDEATQYERLIANARLNGTPLDGLIATRNGLLICANQLSKEVSLDEADKIAVKNASAQYTCYANFQQHMESHR